MRFLLILLYNFVYILLLPVVVLYMIFVRKRSFVYVFDRLFGVSARKLKISEGKRRIWIHAVSLGESRLAVRLAQVIQSDEIDVVISSSTPSGMSFISRQWNTEKVFYCPWDLVFVMDRIVKMVSPDILVLMETELWPSLVYSAFNSGIDIFLVNARLSASSVKGYSKISHLIKCFFAPQIKMVLCRGKEDVENFIKIGFPKDRVMLVGNLKYSLLPRKVDLPILDMLSRERNICVVGSIHLGEEKLLLKDWTGNNMKGWSIILCPRHIENKSYFERSLREMGFRVVFLSSVNEQIVREVDVIIVDKYGILSGMYKWATAVFIGGSLIPKGGQNIIEPAWWQVPICFGRYMDNFEDVVSLFLRRNAAMQISGSEEFVGFCRMAARGELDKMAKAAKEISNEYADIVYRYKEVLLASVANDKCD